MQVLRVWQTDLVNWANASDVITVDEFSLILPMVEYYVCCDVHSALRVSHARLYYYTKCTRKIWEKCKDG